MEEVTYAREEVKWIIGGEGREKSIEKKQQVQKTMTFHIVIDVE